MAKSLRALSEANARLNALNFGIVKTLARSIDANSAWTAGHSERVTRTAVKLGKTMGLGDQEQKRLQIGGLLHDIGKIGIPTNILDKHGKLTNEEFTKIREHPAKGARILEPLEQLSDVIPLIEQHHERFDGMGYPYGLAANEIDPCAWIGHTGAVSRWKKCWLSSRTAPAPNLTRKSLRPSFNSLRPRVERHQNQARIVLN